MTDDTRQPWLRDGVAAVLLAIGAVLVAAAWLVFDYEVALGVLVATLTLSTAAVVARLLLTDDLD